MCCLRIQGTRRPQRKRIVLRSLVLDRVGSPGKHRRVVVRLVAHLCWFETNVGTETVSRTDERLIVLNHHWSDEPTITGTGVDGNRYDTPDVLQQPQFWSCPSTNGTYTKCCFLDLPVVITIGNHHVSRRPDDHHGYGYFHVRLYWTEVGFQASSHLCWSEVNVGPEAVYRIDGLSSDIGPHWLSPSRCSGLII